MAIQTLSRTLASDRVRVLADTHVLIWFAQDDPRLSSHTHRLPGDSSVTFYFSLESIREIAIKAALDKVDFHADAREIHAGLVRNRWTELSIHAEHVFMLAQLPPIHRDPFDRMLVAQVVVEGFTLMTADTLLERYSVRSSSRS